MKSGSPASQCSGDEPQDAYAATRCFNARCIWITSPNFPTESESPIMRMLGGGASGAGLEDFFVLPSATRIKLPMPRTNARGNRIGWSNFDQSFLTGMIGMSDFVLHPDVGLEIDQAGIILRFCSFPNGVFELVQLQPVRPPDPPAAEPLFLQLDIGWMHHQNLFLGIFPRDDFRHLIDVTDEEFLVGQKFFDRHRLRF